MGVRVRYIIGTTLVLTILAVAGGLAFIYSGIYNIAANEPHLRIFRWAVTTMQNNSVHRRAKEIQVPPLDDPALLRHGFLLYHQECLICHGAPGIERPVIGRGINPNPPRLTMDAPQWSDAEIFWMIKHGIKMGGMPAFDTQLTETDMWAITAFVRRLPRISHTEYQAMVAAAEGRLDPARVSWVQEEDPGYALLVAEGNAERGKLLLDGYGCGACHVIPGIRWARGKTGPPLTRWAERHYIAGAVLNNPKNLVAWIVDPQAIEPGTAMPNLGVAPEQALDMAAYLYTLGEPPRALRSVRQAGR